MPAPAPPPTDRFTAGTLGVVGVGLIGGSIAAAAKRRGVAGHVVGFGRDAGRLAAARDAGLLDDFSTRAAHAGAVDLLVVCTPVGRIAADVRRFLPHLSADAAVTDAGSVKGPICEALREQPRFVGSHPLAGSEKAGWEHADADLFAGRTVVVCPDGWRESQRRVRAFWEALGARVVELGPEEHDARLARTSHLPHALAAALCLAADPGDSLLTSTGFADTTRVAAGDAGLWADIFHANAGPARDAVDRLTDRLGELRSALTARDRAGIEAWLAEAADRRERLTRAA